MYLPVPKNKTSTTCQLPLLLHLIQPVPDLEADGVAVAVLQEVAQDGHTALQADSFPIPRPPPSLVIYVGWDLVGLKKKTLSDLLTDLKAEAADLNLRLAVITEDDTGRTLQPVNNGFPCKSETLKTSYVCM